MTLATDGLRPTPGWEVVCDDCCPRCRGQRAERRFESLTEHLRCLSCGYGYARRSEPPDEFPAEELPPVRTGRATPDMLQISAEAREAARAEEIRRTFSRAAGTPRAPRASLDPHAGQRTAGGAACVCGAALLGGGSVLLSLAAALDAPAWVLAACCLLVAGGAWCMLRA